MHYRDEVVCAAGRVVAALRQRSGDDASFSSLHVRRGDLIQQVQINSTAFLPRLFAAAPCVYMADDAAQCVELQHDQ
jgi:hypothetical protein